MEKTGLAPLIKQLTEAALEVALESHLSVEVFNRKNGKSSKTMKSNVGFTNGLHARPAHPTPQV